MCSENHHVYYSVPKLILKNIYDGVLTVPKPIQVSDMRNVRLIFSYFKMNSAKMLGNFGIYSTVFF